MKQSQQQRFKFRALGTSEVGMHVGIETKSGSQSGSAFSPLTLPTEGMRSGYCADTGRIKWKFGYFPI